MEDELDARVKNAPRHGLNARALILLELEASKDHQAEAARREQERERGARRAAKLQAIQRRGPDFLAALDVRERPSVPFVLRPRTGQAPRVIRMKVLARLAGEHLALAALRQGGGLEPAALAAAPQLWQPAVAAAAAQESELCAACTGQQVYQNRAARTSALHWEERHQPQQPAPAAAPPQPPAKRARTEAGAPGADAPAHRAAGQLLEEDLDFGGPQEAGSEDTDGEEEQRQEWERAEAQERERAKAQERQARQARLAEALGSSPRPQQRKQQQEWQAQADKRKPGPGRGPCAAKRAAKLALPPPSSAVTVLGAGLPAVEPSVGAAAGPELNEGAEDGAERQDLQSGACRGADEAPALAPEPAGSSRAAAACEAASSAGADSVALEVRLFVQAEVEPLQRRGELSQAECEAVCERATLKVLSRHGGDAHADFLAREGAAVSRLVAAYVEHVRKQRGRK